MDGWAPHRPRLGSNAGGWWMAMGWSRTGSEVLYEGQFVTLHRDSVVRPVS